jgi:TonB family protein
MNGRQSALLAMCVWCAAITAFAQDEAPLLTLLKPRPLHRNAGTCPAPVFPSGALRVEATGVTTVSFVVEPSGKVSRIDVVQKSGVSEAHGLLDAAAVKSIAACDFGPAEGFGPRRAAQSFQWKIED